jgi:hypothetical protein
MTRAVGSFGVFVIGLMMMSVVCTWSWDAFVSAKLYYCTDGGMLDFWCAGDWVHHPVPVMHVVPRSMSEPDEIKEGWSITALWFLWSAFVLISALISALFARFLWIATKNNLIQGHGRVPLRLT